MREDHGAEPQPDESGALHELEGLIGTRLYDYDAGSCPRLEARILWELRLHRSPANDTMTSLVYEVVTRTVDDARAEALEMLPKVTRFRELRKLRPFRVVAAGELLRYTGDEFLTQVMAQKQFRDHFKDVDLRDVDPNQKRESYRRASISMGNTSIRSGQRDRRSALKALLTAIGRYVGRNRMHLVALATGDAAPAAGGSDTGLDVSAGTRSADPRSPPRPRWINRIRIWTGAVAVIAVVVAATATVRILDDEPERESASGRGTAASIHPNETTRLSQLPKCRELPLNSPLAMELRASNQAIIDGRCDIDPSAAVGGYAGPHQGRFTRLDRLYTGDIIEDICLLYGGQRLRAMRGPWSRVWVRYRSDAGHYAFAPAVWVQGDGAASHCVGSKPLS